MVNEGDGRPTIKQTVKKLLKEEGWRGFYKGLGPRFFSMSLWGTSMITTYEFLSKLLIPPAHFSILCSDELYIILSFSCACCEGKQIDFMPVILVVQNVYRWRMNDVSRPSFLSLGKTAVKYWRGSENRGHYWSVGELLFQGNYVGGIFCRSDITLEPQVHPIFCGKHILVAISDFTINIFIWMHEGIVQL